MAHPSHEEWMTYLYEDLDSKSRAALDAHLDACAACRAQLAAWRAASAELDAWELPAIPQRRRGVAGIVRVGIAAALLLAIGYCIGRLAAPPPPDEEALRAALEPALRQSIESALRRDLREEIERELRDDLDKLAAQMLAASRAAANDVLLKLAPSIDLARAQDRQAMIALLRETESRRLADHARLQNDLETIAAATEVELLRTEEVLARLVAYNMPSRAVPEGWEQ